MSAQEALQRIRDRERIAHDAQVKADAEALAAEYHQKVLDLQAEADARWSAIAADHEAAAAAIGTRE